jgi:hypothetical protein
VLPAAYSYAAAAAAAARRSLLPARPRRGYKHILLIGSVLNVPEIENFLEEFYHPVPSLSGVGCCRTAYPALRAPALRAPALLV